MTLLKKFAEVALESKRSHIISGEEKENTLEALSSVNIEFPASPEIDCKEYNQGHSRMQKANFSNSVFEIVTVGSERLLRETSKFH